MSKVIRSRHMDGMQTTEPGIYEPSLIFKSGSDLLTKHRGFSYPVFLHLKRIHLLSELLHIPEKETVWLNFSHMQQFSMYTLKSLFWKTVSGTNKTWPGEILHFTNGEELKSVCYTWALWFLWMALNKDSEADAPMTAAFTQGSGLMKWSYLFIHSEWVWLHRQCTQSVIQHF